jgi:hypothetical protein
VRRWPAALVGAALAACADTPVSIPPIVAVSIAADSVVLPLGDTVRLGASVRQADGRLLDTLAAPPTWLSRNPVVVSRVGTSARGAFVAVAPGQAWVVAIAGPASDSALVRVPQPIAGLSVDSVTLGVGDTASVTASLFVAPGVDRANQRGVSWSVADATIARVQPATGVTTRVQAVRTGATTVQANIGGVLRTARVVVR